MWAYGNRQLAHYPPPRTRRLYLVLVVLITVALYYALYVGGGVATLTMKQVGFSFDFLVGSLALGNALGAFASLLAGVLDRFGRARLVVYGLLVVSLLTTFAVPHAHDKYSFTGLGIIVGFIEGIILVATPALTRDFSPQVGRATAMGMWAMGPVLGSLLTSAVISATLSIFGSWQAQFQICGLFGLGVFALAFLFLKELKPELRDQVMVSERDRVLNEVRARGLDTAHAHAHPWRRVLRPDILASALGVSLLLLVYYTVVAFGVIYLVTIFHFTPARANLLLNWCWAANTAALFGAGLLSDRLGVRKPFMLAGGAGAAVLIWLFLAQPVAQPSFTAMAAVACAISMLLGTAYAAWMASFTETVEAHHPALTANGLAVWGWLLRLVVMSSFLSLPRVVHPFTDPAAWRQWFTICALGAVAFVGVIFTMQGYWRPAAARAAKQAHDAAVARALAAE